jgi:hypothetical protein
MGHARNRGKGRFAASTLLPHRRRIVHPGSQAGFIGEAWRAANLRGGRDIANDAIGIFTINDSSASRIGTLLPQRAVFVSIIVPKV